MPLNADRNRYAWPGEVKAFHRALSRLGGLVGVLDPIVQILRSTVLHAGCQPSVVRCPMGHTEKIEPPWQPVPSDYRSLLLPMFDHDDFRFQFVGDSAPYAGQQSDVPTASGWSTGPYRWSGTYRLARPG
jgi:hypothetical protein